MIAGNHPYQVEFDRILNNKKSVDLLLERIFKPEKYKDFHDYLDYVHAEWVKSMWTL